MIIRLHDCPAQPWKNGLGSTREIAVHPADAGSDDFLWRVSIAEVDSAAPFSVFPGIDRQIVLLDGAGFRMTMDGEQVHELVRPFEPFAFPGEAHVAVTLSGGATRDFNLMLRRARLRGEVQVWRTAGARPVDAAMALVYCARGSIHTRDGVLHQGDAWRPEDPAPSGQKMILHDGAVALLIRIEPAGLSGVSTGAGTGVA
ncbi:MAG: HutD family protein [Rhodanobacter sp.]